MKTKYITTAGFTLALGLGLVLAGCGESDSGDNHAHGPDSHDHAPASQQPAAGGDTHVHADGSTHAAHEPDPASHTDASGDHAHHDDEVALDPATIGEMTVELAQGHGAVEPGKEGHLIVKLPYNDNGATIVRAWIGTEDRTLSYVGRGDYAPSHDDYDIHAMAPDPLPENTMWWIEIEKPDGTKVIGSAVPILD
jgi:hypothetical protein